MRSFDFIAVYDVWRETINSYVLSIFLGGSAGAYGQWRFDGTNSSTSGRYGGSSSSSVTSSTVSGTDDTHGHLAVRGYGYPDRSHPLHSDSTNSYETQLDQLLAKASVPAHSTRVNRRSSGGTRLPRSSSDDNGAASWDSTTNSSNNSSINNLSTSLNEYKSRRASSALEYDSLAEHIAQQHHLLRQGGEEGPSPPASISQQQHSRDRDMSPVRERVHLPRSGGLPATAGMTKTIRIDRGGGGLGMTIAGGVDTDLGALFVAQVVSGGATDVDGNIFYAYSHSITFTI